MIAYKVVAVRGDKYTSAVLNPEYNKEAVFYEVGIPTIASEYGPLFCFKTPELAEKWFQVKCLKDLPKEVQKDITMMKLFKCKVVASERIPIKFENIPSSYGFVYAEQVTLLEEVCL